MSEAVVVALAELSEVDWLSHPMAVVTMVPVRSWSGCSCRCGCRKCVRQRKDIKDIRGLLGVAEDATELIAAVESGVEERTTDLSLPRHLQHFTRVARPLPISRTTSPREGKRVERPTFFRLHAMSTPTATTTMRWFYEHRCTLQSLSACRSRSAGARSAAQRHTAARQGEATPRPAPHDTWPNQDQMTFPGHRRRITANRGANIRTCQMGIGYQERGRPVRETAERRIGGVHRDVDSHSTELRCTTLLSRLVQTPPLITTETLNGSDLARKA
ncbi:hypothetical protein KC355_g64 [Hortaea werneckii]|nr:hypothetical protein KC355_g64 [Hortaea werneckii]